MRLSLIVDPSRPWLDMVDLARAADQGGWHAVYTCDHFMPYDVAGTPQDGPVLEGWTTLTALAAETSTARLGTLVLSATYRHPAVVANMAAALDHVSGGRLILGLGAGWQVNEHVAYSIPMPDTRQRIAALDDACTAIRALLSSRRTTRAGTFPLVDAPMDPKPIQSRLPILIGSRGERYGLRVVARHADIWHSWSDADRFAHLSAVLDEHCEREGRDPASIQRITGGTLDADAFACLATLSGLAEAGAQEYVLLDDATATTTAEALTRLAVLTERVLPEVS